MKKINSKIDKAVIYNVGKMWVVNWRDNEKEYAFSKEDALKIIKAKMNIGDKIDIDIYDENENKTSTHFFKSIELDLNLKNLLSQISSNLEEKNSKVILDRIAKTNIYSVQDYNKLKSVLEKILINSTDKKLKSLAIDALVGIIDFNYKNINLINTH